MKQIKIVFCIDQLNVGGTENQLLATIRNLDPELFQTSIICLRRSEFLDDYNGECEIQVLDVTSLLSFNGILKLIKFSRLLKQEKVNIVQTFFFDSTFFGITAAKLAGISKTISCRRDMGFWYSPNLIRTLKLLNRYTDRILVNSNAVKENVIKFESPCPDTIDVLYNGLDVEAYKGVTETKSLKHKLNIPKENYIVGILANLNRPVKRVDLFIRIAEIILQKIKPISFVIIGDGHLRPQLEELASQLGIAKSVHFTGLQHNVAPYLQLIDVGCLTSESEGFANALIEYMAAGIPCIAFDVGGNNEIIENGINGYLVKDGNSGEYADKVCSLLEDDDRYGKMARAAKSKAVQSFDWRNQKHEIMKYYKNLLDC